MGCLQSAWLQQISLCQSGSLSTAHGIYYDCYLPLYVFCGRHLLVAKLRRADLDAAAGAVEEIARIVAQVRRRWPRVRILLRADGGFARDDLMAWCEANGADFLFGLARNERLVCEIATELDLVAAKSRRTGRPERRFKSFMWTTRASWSCRRRVVAKAEWTQGEANPRFVVTSLRRDECKAKYLYEKLYCARGEMENRIKECQLDLYADRTSAATMRANQLRLWFYSMAYVLMCALRRIGLHDTDFAQATCGTIRLKLLKIGALVRISVRRIKIAMASALSGRPRLGTCRDPSRHRSHRPRLARMTRPAAARPSRHQPIGPRRTQKNKPQRALGRHGPAWLQHTSHQTRLIPCAIH